jgi:Polysaccharide pyruvyl transferase
MTMDLRRLLARFLPQDRRAPTFSPRIALCGLFDLPSYGDLLVPRVLERELRRRLPLARVHTYAPLGRPIAMDGGRPALPLPPKEELAEQHDLVVITGDVIHARDDLYAEAYGDELEKPPSSFFVDGLGPELERRCPVAWHAVGVPFDLDPHRLKSALDSKSHVSARDAASKQRLLAAGSTREIVVVPEATLLAARLFRSEVLEKRLEYLRVMGWYPKSTPPLVIEAGTSIAGRQIDGPVVLVELGPREAETPEEQLPDTVFRLPAQASLEDIATAIAHARAFLCASPHGRATALSFGVPLLDGEGETSCEQEVDTELDALAGLAERSWSDRADEATPAALARALAAAEERYEVLAEAHDARGKRLLNERLQFAEIVDRLEDSEGGLSADAAARIAELEQMVFIAQGAEAEARHELEALRADREGDG